MKCIPNTAGKDCYCGKGKDVYNSNMYRLRILTIFLCFLVTGCSKSAKESEYDKVSREIERIKAEAARESQASGSPGGNIKIQVKLLNTTLLQYGKIDVLWQYVDRGQAVVGRTGTLAVSGLKIGVATKQFEAKLSAVQKELTACEETTLFLVVADGTGGTINIGTEIAVPQFQYMGRWYSGTEYGFRQAGKALRVYARTLPSGEIEMELVPAFSNFLSSGGDLELTELATTVRIQPGETVVLGGQASSNQDVGAAMFGQRHGGRDTQTIMTVTASYL